MELLRGVMSIREANFQSPSPTTNPSRPYCVNSKIEKQAEEEKNGVLDKFLVTS